MKLSDLTYPIDEEIEESKDRIEYHLECIRDGKLALEMDRAALADERAYLRELKELASQPATTLKDNQ